MQSCAFPEGINPLREKELWAEVGGVRTRADTWAELAY